MPIGSVDLCDIACYHEVLYPNYHRLCSPLPPPPPPCCKQLFRCHLDTDSYGPPYNRIDDHSVQDSRGNVIRLYPEARAICHALHDAGVELAVASRSPVKSWYKQVLDVLDLSPVVGAMYIGGGSNFGTPGSKVRRCPSSNVSDLQDLMM